MKELRSIGINPDISVPHRKELSREIKAKLALFCDVEDDAVIQCIDAKSIYEVL